MKFKSTYILALVALAIGAYIYFVEIKKAEKDQAAKTADEKIFNAIDVSKAKVIKLSTTFGEYELEKDEKNSWQIKVPVKDTADDQTLNNMLTALGSEKYEQVVAEGEADLKIFGLDQPKVFISITTADQKTQKVNVGAEAALPGKLYIQREGEKKVLFATQSFKSQVDKGLKDLRNKNVFRKSKSDVVSIEARYNQKANNATIELLKENGEWKVVKPFSLRADQDTVNDLLVKIENLRANDFASEKGNEKSELSKFNLANPEMKFVLKDKDKKVVEELWVGAKKENNAYVKTVGSPTIFTMFSTSTEPLSHKPDDFRDKKEAFKFKKDDVAAISLKSSLFNTNLVKKGTTWELVVPDAHKEVNQVVVTDLLNRLEQLKASEFIKNEAPKGLNPPRGAITLSDAAGKPLIVFSWGDKTKSGKSYFIKTSLSKDVYGVDASTLDSLPGQTLVSSKDKSPAPKTQSTPFDDPPLPEEIDTD